MPLHKNMSDPDDIKYAVINALPWVPDVQVTHAGGEEFIKLHLTLDEAVELLDGISQDKPPSDLAQWDLEADRDPEYAGLEQGLKLNRHYKFTTDRARPYYGIFLGRTPEGFWAIKEMEGEQRIATGRTLRLNPAFVRFYEVGDPS